MVQYQDMSDTAYEKFWKWFQKHEEGIFFFEDQDEILLQNTLSALQEINEEMVFEIGPEIDGMRELVISANGAKTAFADVIETAKSAPDLDRWDIVPFRQRKDMFDMEVMIDDLIVSPQDLRFSYEREKGRVNLSIFVEGLDVEDEKTYHLVFLILDNSIGEYDVEMKIGSIDIYDSIDIADDEVLYPLTKLPHVVDSVQSNSVH